MYIIKCLCLRLMINIMYTTISLSITTKIKNRNIMFLAVFVISKSKTINKSNGRIITRYTRN